MPQVDSTTTQGKNIEGRKSRTIFAPAEFLLGISDRVDSAEIRASASAQESNEIGLGSFLDSDGFPDEE